MEKKMKEEFTSVTFADPTEYADQSILGDETYLKSCNITQARRNMNDFISELSIKTKKGWKIRRKKSLDREDRYGFTVKSLFSGARYHLEMVGCGISKVKFIPSKSPWNYFLKNADNSCRLWEYLIKSILKIEEAQ